MVPEPLSVPDMLAALATLTGVEFSESQRDYESFAARATLAVQYSDFHGRLHELVTELSETRIAGKIRAIENWSNGESFRVIPKPWESLIDKLYRLNKEENNQYSQPPILPTLDERALNRTGHMQRWVTPPIAHEVVDDLIRTKVVVPFVDQVAEVGDKLTDAMNDCGTRRFRRFHAKDSGYHARHYYALIPVPGDDTIPATTVAFEVKILTKMQDLLSELTHILYEKHRVGAVPLSKKRKVAWELGTPDFLATYLGHGGHFIEAAICDLKDKILELEAGV